MQTVHSLPVPLYFGCLPPPYLYNLLLCPDLHTMPHLLLSLPPHALACFLPCLALPGNKDGGFCAVHCGRWPAMSPRLQHTVVALWNTCLVCPTWFCLTFLPGGGPSPTLLLPLYTPACYSDLVPLQYLTPFPTTPGLPMPDFLPFTLPAFYLPAPTICVYSPCVVYFPIHLPYLPWREFLPSACLQGGGGVVVVFLHT